VIDDKIQGKKTRGFINLTLCTSVKPRVSPWLNFFKSKGPWLHLKREVRPAKILPMIWAHFRLFAPETGLCGVPLRSILCAERKERFAPLQSLALGLFRQL
jgi:hypothetical protein